MSDPRNALQSWKGNPEASLVEARRRVAVCAEKNDVALYLGDLDLDRLPEGISTLPRLTELRMFGGRIVDFSPLAPLSNLELLEIGPLKCPCPGLDFMSGWTRLQSLDIMTARPVDLKPVASCTMLKRLSIWCGENRVDLLNLEALAGFAALEYLSLGGTQSERFDAIRKCTRLKVVQLARTNMAKLTGFHNLRRLESLSLREASISDLSPLSGLAALEQLTLSDMPASDLSPLASLPLLRRLDISNTRVSDLSPLVQLAKCQREFNETKRREDPFWFDIVLEDLKIDKSDVTDISPLANLDGLQHVSLGHTAVSSIDPLRSCKALRRMNIAETAVTDLGPGGTFRHLVAFAAPGTRIKSLQALEPASALQWLDIANTDIADLTSIANAYDCRSLILRGSQVADLAAIIDTGSRQSQEHGDSGESLDFRDTPASRSNERFAELAAMADQSPRACFFETKRYLQELAKSRSRSRHAGH